MLFLSFKRMDFLSRIVTKPHLPHKSAASSQLSFTVITISEQIFVC